MSYQAETERYDQFTWGLQHAGFSFNEPVYSFTPDFTVDDLFRAQYESTYSNPIFLQAVLNCDPVKFAVDMVRSIYLVRGEGYGDTPLGCHDDPNWYIEGWLPKSGYDPYREIVRVRILFEPQFTADLAYIQTISDKPALPKTEFDVIPAS